MCECVALSHTEYKPFLLYKVLYQKTNLKENEKEHWILVDLDENFDRFILCSIAAEQKNI